MDIYMDTYIKCNAPIDDNPGRSGLFVVIHYQNDRLAKDPPEFFVGNQDAARFDVIDFVRPAVLVHVHGGVILWLDVNGKLVGRQERVLARQLGLCRNAAADGIPPVNILVRVGILQTIRRRRRRRLLGVPVSGFENRRDCGTEHLAEFFLSFEIIVWFVGWIFGRGKTL